MVPAPVGMAITARFYGAVSPESQVEHRLLSKTIVQPHPCGVAAIWFLFLIHQNHRKSVPALAIEGPVVAIGATGVYWLGWIGH